MADRTKRIIRSRGAAIQIAWSEIRLAAMGGNATARRAGAGHLGAAEHLSASIRVEIVEIDGDQVHLDVRLPNHARLEDP